MSPNWTRKYPWPGGKAVSQVIRLLSSCSKIGRSHLRANKSRSAHFRLRPRFWSVSLCRNKSRFSPSNLSESPKPEANDHRLLMSLRRSPQTAGYWQDTTGLRSSESIRPMVHSPPRSWHQEASRRHRFIPTRLLRIRSHLRPSPVLK